MSDKLDETRVRLNHQIWLGPKLRNAGHGPGVNHIAQLAGTVPGVPLLGIISP